jgi:hypothetical protein
MTLGRLLLAWLPVAAWFAALGWASHRWIGIAASPAPSRAGLGWIGVEALLVTLFGSLWFDSLGHGGWWLLFGLVGLLAARLPTSPGRFHVALPRRRGPAGLAAGVISRGTFPPGQTY